MTGKIRLAYAISVSFLPFVIVGIVAKLGAHPDWRGAFLCTVLLLIAVARCERETRKGA